MPKTKHTPAIRLTVDGGGKVKEGPDKLRGAARDSEPGPQDFGFVSSTRFSMRLAMLDAA